MAILGLLLLDQFAIRCPIQWYFPGSFSIWHTFNSAAHSLSTITSFRQVHVGCWTAFSMDFQPIRAETIIKTCDRLCLYFVHDERFHSHRRSAAASSMCSLLSVVYFPQNEHSERDNDRLHAMCCEIFRWMGIACSARCTTTVHAKNWRARDNNINNSI